MAKIIKMNDHLTNLIAAGEVIDKISSVVKELVENSIDAFSTEIEVNLLYSGTKEIIVIDNGEGMDKEDIKMSFVRNATSKIKNKQDLYHINTLGFRGEAIPSIAAVSDMTIRSNNGVGGYYINYKSSKLVSEGTTPINKGTVVIVKNIFYNTPARLKYLKSNNIELANIIDLMDKLVIANPSISFKLTNNKKTILQTRGNNDMIPIIGEVFGLEAAKNTISFSDEKKGIKIKAFLIKPAITNAKRNKIVLIVNKRSVRNNNIIKAIIEGYSTYIPIGRYPIAIIFISIDPLLIDVNVHPSKAEIKFSSEKDIKDYIIEVISKNLKVNNIIPEYKPDINYSTTGEQTKIDFSFIEEEKEYVAPKRVFPYFEYVGQFSGTYLIFQNEEGIYLIDQHAAAERINYEYYYEELGSNIKSSQELLIPINIELTKKRKIYVVENISVFRELGFNIEESGINSIYIRSIPLWVKGDIEMVAEEIVNYLINEEVVLVSKIRDALAKMISCKKSIKANHSLSKNEIDYIIENLKTCKNPYNCPHGRPTIVKMTNYEIEKMFKRVI